MLIQARHGRSSRSIYWLELAIPNQLDSIFQLFVLVSWNTLPIVPSMLLHGCWYNSNGMYENRKCRFQSVQLGVRISSYGNTPNKATSLSPQPTISSCYNSLLMHSF